LQNSELTPGNALHGLFVADNRAFRAPGSSREFEGSGGYLALTCLDGALAYSRVVAEILHRVQQFETLGLFCRNHPKVPRKTLLARVLDIMIRICRGLWIEALNADQGRAIFSF
jgi:hypothetical protein